MANANHRAVGQGIQNQKGTHAQAARQIVKTVGPGPEKRRKL